LLLRSPELHPNGENATLDELKVAMDAAPNMRSYIRLTVIRSLLLGITRATICQQFCRTDRVVRLWIELFNRGGIDALITRPKPGRPRKVKLERVRDLLVPVLENPAQAGQVHWTGVKLHGYVKEQLQIDLGYSTTIRWLHELDFHLRFPQPWPERQNEEDRKRFMEGLCVWVADPQVELWFSDECGVEGDPRPRRRWVQPGKRRTVPIWAITFGRMSSGPSRRRVVRSSVSLSMGSTPTSFSSFWMKWPRPCRKKKACASC